MENKINNIFTIYRKNLLIVKNVVLRSFDVTKLDFSICALENVTNELLELKNDSLAIIKNDLLRKTLSNYNPYKLESISYGEKNITLIIGYKSEEQLNSDLSRFINEVNDGNMKEEIKEVFEEFKLTSKCIKEEIRKMKTIELEQEIMNDTTLENVDTNNLNQSLSLNKLDINLFNNDSIVIIDEFDIVDIEEENYDEVYIKQEEMYSTLATINNDTYQTNEIHSDLFNSSIEEQNNRQLNLEEENLLKLNYLKDELNEIIEFYEIKEDLSYIPYDKYPEKEVIMDLYSLNINKYNRYLEVEKIINLNNLVDYYVNYSQMLTSMIENTRATIKSNKINQYNALALENKKTKVKTLVNIA